MTMRPVPTFLQIPYADDPSELDVGIIGLPFDLGTTSGGRARLGPLEIRKAGMAWPRRYHQSMEKSPFDICKIADLGDLDLDYFDKEAALKDIEAYYNNFVDAGALPLGLGGDHLVTLPILRALGRKRPLGLVLFDAHPDTVDISMGSNLVSSTPFRRAIEEGVLDPRRVVEIGIRGAMGRRDHIDWAKSVGVTIIDIDELYDLGTDGAVAKAHEIIGHHPAYISFCIDGVDPVYAPGTGVRVPGGFTSYEAIRMIRKLDGLNVVGADIVEFSPPQDIGGITAELSVYLAFEAVSLFARTLDDRKK